jgi:tetratricopeptide (TPR) repeat protein
MVTQRTKATIEGAVREFEEAITFDPDYALAHAELAMAIRLLQNDAYGDLTTLEVESIGLPHAERALVLDPNLAEAHVAMGAFQETREERLAHYEQAIRINPNYSYVHVAMSGMLNALGRYEEMFSASEKAVRLDPLSFPAIRVYVYALILRNRLDDASRELDKISSIYPALYAWMSGLLNSVGGNRANFIFGLLDALMIDPESVLVRNFLTFRFASIGLEQEALEISDVTWPYVFNILGRPRDAVAKTEALLAVDPAKDFYRNSLAHALAAVGEYARARPILEESWERNERRVTHNSFVFSYGEAMALIAIRRDAGDEAGARELLEAIRKDVGNRRKAGIIRAEIHESVDFEEGIFAFLIGEREKGLALISKGVEDGFFIPPNEAYLQTLYDDPGFAPILADQEARQARERNRFLAIVCTDNPYEEVWQPAEGTCEQFAAEGGN